MKNLILFLIVFTFYSCSSDDDNISVKNQEYLEELLGRYELKAAYLENPIDLNGDGIEGTNLLQEIEYSDMSKHLESYWATIIKRDI